MMAEAPGIGRVTEHAMNRRGLEMRIEECLVYTVEPF